MKRVVVVGCGIVGAAIAYELSRCPGLQVTVIDPRPPASGSTGAALGVLMAVISQRVKGRNWRLRQQSWQRYQTLLPELEAITGQRIQRNTHGILSLCFDPEEMPRWRSLQTIRQSQGHTLELWSPAQVIQRCPHLQGAPLVGAVYSPTDFQVNPTALTQALVAAAAALGATFALGEPAVEFSTDGSGQRCLGVNTPSSHYGADWVVLAAGLGTLPLTATQPQPVAVGPVLGQALRLRLETPLGDPHFQPVVNGHDIHLVPLGQGDYWVGATVEFPPADDWAGCPPLKPEAARLEEVLQGAIAYCPALAQATVSDRWFGLRPRPQGQAAPIIQPLRGYSNIWLATGHYRNGVLLAPATALAVRDQALLQLASPQPPQRD